MNFHQLIQQHESLVRQARLANIAYAWRRLADFAGRFERAQLRGPARLRLAEPEAERLWPVLVPLEANASVVEEHFTDEDVVELADLLAFAGAAPDDGEIGIRFDTFARQFLPGLEEELRRAGIAVPSATDLLGPAEEGGAGPSGGPSAADGGTDRMTM